MIFMTYRLTELGLVLDGLRATHLPLLEKINDAYKAAGIGDDEGIYYFIPWIANTFGISLSLAINLFFWVSMSAVSMGALACFLRMFKNRLFGAVAFLG